MGTITITVDGGAGGTATKTFTVSNPNLLRLVAWAKTFGNPGGGPPPNNAQAMEKWMEWIISMTKAHLIEDERRKANVPDFDATAP